MSDRNDNSNPLDQATSARLGRLRAIPVDATGLASRLRGAIPDLEAQQESQRSIRRFLTPLRAAAVVLIVVGAVFGVMLAASGGTALASVDQLAALHEENIADKDHAVHVDSIAAANAELSKEWPGRPDVPQVPDGVMSCCVHQIGRKKMACVVLNVDGQPVTVAAAKTADIKCPMGTMTMRNGVMYCSHSVRGVNMIMVQRGDQWTCYMGKVSADRLADLAATGAQ